MNEPFGNYKDVSFVRLTPEGHILECQTIEGLRVLLGLRAEPSSADLQSKSTFLSQSCSQFCLQE